MNWRPGTVGTPSPRYEPRATQRAVLTESDLTAAGWDDDAVRRLQTLRDGYVAIEWTDDRQSYDRLCLVRWLYRQGRLRT